jgi:hypothetical protein
MSAKRYRCFFCDEVFTDRKAAWLHFGDENCTSDVPACVDPLRLDEKMRMNRLREAVEEANKARQALSEMQDWEADYAQLQEDIRRYFGKDCNSIWTAGDRYKSALNRISDLENAVAAEEHKR